MLNGKSSNKTRAPLARYANYYEVGHNTWEFLIDFGQFRPESSDVALHTRVVLGPIHAKLLAKILSDAVTQYESHNGAIAELTEELNPLDAVLRSLPDFERRAIEVRRDPLPSSKLIDRTSATSKRKV